MKANTIIVKPKDLERIIRRGINTLDPQLIPAWAHDISYRLAEVDDVLITFIDSAPEVIAPTKPDTRNPFNQMTDETSTSPSISAKYTMDRTVATDAVLCVSRKFGVPTARNVMRQSVGFERLCDVPNGQLVKLRNDCLAFLQHNSDNHE